MRLLQLIPGAGALRLLTRQLGFTVTVFHVLQNHVDVIADLDGQLTLTVPELFEGNNAFGLKSSIDNDEVIIDAHDLTDDKAAGRDLGALQTLFE